VLAGKPLEEQFEKPAPKAAKVIIENEEIAEPTKRVTKKPEVAPAAKKNLADVISAWSQDE
jgi:hypothetical protein